MKQIALIFTLDEEQDYAITSIIIDRNNTKLPNNSKMIKAVCNATVKNLEKFPEAMDMQDTLNELGIDRADNLGS